MSFIDKVQIIAIAGNGGDGKMSFRQEKFIDKGGPDGGDGGNGGDIILIASRNQNTLATFRYQKEIQAEHGKPGGKTRKHGRSAKNLLVDVPVGTVATNEKGEIIADLIIDQQQIVIAHGGHGGFGNAHFVSSRRQAPKFAEKGEPGEQFNIQLEIKMIADVGLIGLPNAGKSTLLSRISNARPEIADYPFTTLQPNLGVVDIDAQTSILFADIPGLIEGAARGKGLGHDFLRHIERTAVLIHLIDAYQDNIAGAYTIIKNELLAYQPELSDRPEMVVINKIEGLDQDIIDDLSSQIRSVAPSSSLVYAISAQAGINISEILFEVKKLVQEVHVRQAAKSSEQESTIPVLQLEDRSRQWQVVKQASSFTIIGPKIEQFARRTDFENEEGLQRLRDIMKRYGILHELVRQGIEPGQSIIISGHHFPY